jgi:group II intron reverse transcriptase/maturase
MHTSLLRGNREISIAGRLRGEHRGQPRKSSPTCSHRSVSSAAIAPDVHTEGDGRQRPLGIAGLEDKIVQSAVVAILTPIYEAEFLGFSYGFRPGRNQHQAPDALAFGIGKRQINWALDCDVQSFFDKVSQDWLIRFVEHRIGDRRIIRLITKWLKAGVLEDGRLVVTEEGTPQGAVISPLLANIYLHYVYDLWTHRWRRSDFAFRAFDHLFASESDRHSESHCPIRKQSNSTATKPPS